MGLLLAFIGLMAILILGGLAVARWVVGGRDDQ
jgi:hypothetical protein